jgi:hypothetical protein
MATNRKSSRKGSDSSGGSSSGPLLEMGRSLTDDSTDSTAVGFVTSSPAHRERAVEEIAYLLAEKRGFVPGFELDDWLAAEKEVDAILAAAEQV